MRAVLYILIGLCFAGVLGIALCRRPVLTGDGDGLTRDTRLRGWLYLLLAGAVLLLVIRFLAFK